MASVLGWEQSEVLLNSDKSGKLIETFVFNELSAQAGLSDDYKLYHYRDRNKREIDFIIECPGDKLIAIEVKSGETANFLDFKHIEWFRNNVAKNKKIIGIVLYGGENVLQVKKDNYVIPIPLLWN
jgi:predicted AAA+ superfamily ATPase